MKLYDLTDAEPKPLHTLPVGIRTVIALGSFDGIHIGHRALLQTASALAVERASTVPAVFTFSPHPFFKEPHCLLTTDIERLHLFRETGIRYVFFADFEAIRTLEPQVFVADILSHDCRADCAVCGNNFHYGCGKSGTNETLTRDMRNADGDAVIVGDVTDDRTLVSSTVIRTLIREGEISRANALLSHPYTISGAILHGNRIGHQMEIPTINLLVPEEKIIPKFGVYISDVTIGEKQYAGLTNIGIRPTFGGLENDITVETHLTDGGGDLYGKNASVSLLAFVRPERRFETVTALKQQIEMDLRTAASYREETK